MRKYARKRTTDIRRELHLEQLGRCWYCARRVPFHLSTADHIKPLSKGGNNRKRNLVMACPQCNTAKGSSDPEALKTRARLAWLRSQPIVRMEMYGASE